TWDDLRLPLAAVPKALGASDDCRERDWQRFERGNFCDALHFRVSREPEGSDSTLPAANRRQGCDRRCGARDMPILALKCAHKMIRRCPDPYEACRRVLQ